jgi:hypothetical protein
MLGKDGFEISKELLHLNVSTPILFSPQSLTTHHVRGQMSTH